MSIDELIENYNQMDRRWSKTGIIPEHLTSDQKSFLVIDLEEAAKYMVEMGMTVHTPEFIESIGKEIFETIVAKSLEFFSGGYVEDLCPDPIAITDQIIEKHKTN